MGLVIEVEGVSDEFVDFDFGGAVEAAFASSMLASLAWSASRSASWSAIGSASAFSAWGAVFSVRGRGWGCCGLIGHGFS